MIGGVLGNSGHIIKSDQIEAVGVNKIVVLWENNPDDKNQEEQKSKYKAEYLKKLKHI